MSLARASFPSVLLRWNPWLLVYMGAHLPRLFGGPIGIDLMIYRRSAELAASGQAASAYSLESGFVYSPLALLLMLPLAWVEPRTGYVALGILNWAALYGLVSVLFRKLDLTGGRALAILILTLATVGRYVGHTVNLGQVNVVIVYVLVLALVAAWEGKRARGSVLYVLANCFKLTPLVFVPYLWWNRRLDLVLVAMAGLLGLNLVAAMLLAGPGALGLLDAYMDRLRVLAEPGHPMNVSFLSLASGSNTAKWVAPGLLTVAFGAFHWLMGGRLRPSTQRGDHERFAGHAAWWAWLMVFALLASPVTWFTHFPFLILPVVVAALGLFSERFPPVWVALFGLVALHAWGTMGRILERMFGAIRYAEDTMLLLLMGILVSLVAPRFAARDGEKRRPHLAARTAATHDPHPWEKPQCRS